ncbi:MAG: sortase [Acidimicrobiia bacterium]|nr:sortase [Acidimicrobiia bacterium]MXZ78162.1 sortase [Acidimicrobiia bacterium]MYB10592.1 sortase [Acidimicrobiia bacterium]MYB73890.1 sortase [Acidimicrobiia bacterium]MYE72180.1 sortase [Acidimicrobiia bacterium]
MTVARVLGTLGKTVIAVGLMILLFGIFQLWGTGIIEARAQQGLDNEFADLLEASSALGPAAPVAPVAPVAPATAAPTPAAAAPEPTAQSPAEDSQQAGATPSPTSNPISAATPQPAGDPPQPDPAWLAMLYRDNGAAIARIQIPAIDVDKTVVEGVRVGDLRKGPGHYPTTPLPGQAGNAAIAGHRTTYGAPFGEIDKLLPDDEIIITTIQGEFIYRVLPQGEGHGHLIVAPTAVEVLDQDFSEHPNRLTLTACHPKGSARQRIIVIAELVGEPAPTYPRPGQDTPGTVELATENLEEAIDSQQTITATPAPEPTEIAAPGPDTTTEPTEQASTAPTATSEPTGQAASLTPEPEPTEVAAAPAPVSAPNDDPPDPAPVPVTPQEAESADSFGEGLDGDSDGLVPAILWGLAALAIWFFALFAGQRWRRLPAYALSAVPFLVVMFMAFWHIDRVLPSY